MQKFLNRIAVFAGLATIGCGEVATVFTYGGVDINGDMTAKIDINGDVRIYVVHIPASVTAETPAPLLMGFHGAGQSGPSFRSFIGIDSVADARGFITVFPSTYSIFNWAVGSITSADTAGIDDMKFVREILDQVTRDLNIDLERVFAMGLSNGAVFTHRLGCQMGNRFAGIASVAATMLENISNGCDANPAVAALFTHGTDDSIFRWEGESEAGGQVVLLSANDMVSRWASRNGCSPTPAVEAIPDTAADGTSSERRLYGTCSSGAEVVFYAITGGGHTWPGAGTSNPTFGNVSQDFDMNEEMLDFFESVARQ